MATERRWGTHYDTLDPVRIGRKTEYSHARGSCSDPKHCDCKCRECRQAQAADK